MMSSLTSFFGALQFILIFLKLFGFLHLAWVFVWLPAIILSGFFVALILGLAYIGHKAVLEDVKRDNEILARIIKKGIHGDE